MDNNQKGAVALIVGAAVTALAVGVVAYALLRRREEVPEPTPPPAGLANLYGVVTDSRDNQPIMDVLITLNGKTTYTDQNGYYIIRDLEPSTYELSAYRDGYNEVIKTVTLSEGNNRLDIKLVAPVTTALSGTVTDAQTGEPIAGVQVYAADGKWAGTVTDSQGRYRVAPLVAGIYVVSFKAGNYETLYVYQVGLAEGENTLDASLTPLPTPPPPTETDFRLSNFVARPIFAGGNPSLCSVTVKNYGAPGSCVIKWSYVQDPTQPPYNSINPWLDNSWLVKEITLNTGESKTVSFIFQQSMYGHWNLWVGAGTEDAPFAYNSSLWLYITTYVTAVQRLIPEEEVEAALADP